MAGRRATDKPKEVKNSMNGKMTIKYWVAVIVPLVSMLIGVGITYGVITADVSHNTQDIAKNYEEHKAFRDVDTQILQALARIEGKLETLEKL